MADLDRLYIITRNDIPVGLQAAQAAHAAFEFSRKHRGITERWMVESNFIVLVTVPDEEALAEIAVKAREERICSIWNYEPDLGDELTAVVLEPCEFSKRLCSSLPLLGRELVMTG